VTPLPGPRTRRLARELERFEAPGINTLVDGTTSSVWQEALGANVLDVDGNRFVDLTSGFGVAAVGHRHPAVVAAIERQSHQLVHGLGDVHAHPARIELAARLARLAPVDEAQVYFAVSGSDAVEIALKTALLATGRPGVLAFEPAYHGLTLGSLAATSRPAFRRPFAPHLHPHVDRLPFGCEPARIEGRLEHGSIGAVLVEPIVGREGVLLPPVGWLAGLAELCRRSGALLVADEIFTGFGRTGRWFAVDHDDVRPDLLCCGKALGGGLPIAAVVGRSSLLAAWRVPGEALHTATFVANPLACAAACAVVALLEDERLPERAAELGVGLARAFEAFASLGLAVRGRGLLWGLEARDRARAQAWSRRALERGVLALAGGAEGRVLQVVPPLTIDSAQLDDAIEVLRGAWLDVCSASP
jgi:4-aminobutyrate aminotransferase-like enzyme